MSMVLDRDLTSSMHCIVPCESRRVEAFRQGSDKKHALYGTQLEEGSRDFLTGV